MSSVPLSGGPPLSRLCLARVWISLILGVVFRQLLCLSSCLAYWRLVNLTTILEDPPSSSVANDNPIFITPTVQGV